MEVYSKSSLTKEIPDIESFIKTITSVAVWYSGVIGQAFQQVFKTWWILLKDLKKKINSATLPKPNVKLSCK